MFYVYVQDYYGNTTAAQYVQVSFDATGGGLYKKVSFEDGKKITRRLVVKGDKLTAKQIPANPGFYNNTTEQKFTQWSDSTDANKKKVDLKTAQMTKSVILNADYDKPSVIIKQMIKGDGIWNNQEFTYKVKTSYPKGKVIPCKGSYVSPAVSAPNITSLTVDANQEITFKLKAGQILELIPGDNQYTIKSIIQDSNGTNCEIQKDAKVISSVANVDVDEISTNFVFTNTKNIVVTGVDGGNTDNSLLLVRSDGSSSNHRSFCLTSEREEEILDGHCRGKVISEESVAGGIFREILYLLLKIVAIATAIVVIFTFIFGVFRYADNAMLPAVKDGDLVFYYRLRNSYVASDLVVLNYQGKEQVRRVISTGRCGGYYRGWSYN